MPLLYRKSERNASRNGVRVPLGRSLSVELLEPRVMLDSSGFITGNDVYLTLSFAGDGTSVAGQSSALVETFDAIAPTADWQAAILRAFQTWAVETNGDIGVVSDSGDPFGSPGPSQDDSRFGDIRIGAIEMSPEVGAVSVPVDGLVSGTWFADVVFNTAFNYLTLDDIYAVALHEAGNVFGLEDNSDPLSPLFIGGAPTGLPPTATDLSELRQLHGVRVPDLNESDEDGGGPVDNDSFANATEFELVEIADEDEGSAPSIVYGDITDSLDRDFFEIETPGDYSGPLSIQVRSSGISLLAPTVSVYDDAQQLVLQNVSNSTSGDWLTLSIPEVEPDETYFVEVTGTAPGLFGIGGFSLVATFDGINQVSQTTIDSIAGGQFRFLEQDDFEDFFDADDDELFGDDAHTNDTSLVATDLITATGFVDATHYEVIASIADATDIDFYNFKSPVLFPEPLDVMTVLVRSLDAGGLIPTASVFDSNGLPVSSTILVNGAGEYIVQVDGVNPDNDYQLKVEAASNSGPFNSGNYSLTVSFSNQATLMTPLAAGTVGDSTTKNIHTLYIGRPQLFHIALSIDPAVTTSPTVVLAVIKNDAGDTIYQIAAGPGETRSREAVFLTAGTYTVEIIPLTLDGSIAPELSYALLGSAISDPFVGDPDDPTNNPFACTEPGLEGFFCYPGGFISPDPFLWDDFIDSLTDPPDLPDLPTLVTFIFGDWWTWVWDQAGVNGPPFGMPDTIQVAETTSPATSPLVLGPTGSVLDNDIDPESDPLVAILQSGPSNGTLTIESDGTFVYTPDLGFAGRDEFTYTAFDFSQESASTTVSIIVGESGDFNATGQIDGADFLAWQQSFGTTTGAVLTNGDSDFDGDVDGQDLTNWQQQFGIIPSQGDFDDDGDFDGGDFLTWQRGFGILTTAAAAEGDADGDRDVDGQDLLAWEENFGTVGALAATIVSEGSSIPTSAALAVAPLKNNASQGTVTAEINIPLVTSIVTPSAKPENVRTTLGDNELSSIIFLESPYTKAFPLTSRDVRLSSDTEPGKHFSIVVSRLKNSHDAVEAEVFKSEPRNGHDQTPTAARDLVFAEFNWNRIRQIRSTLLDAFENSDDELLAPADQ